MGKKSILLKVEQADFEAWSISAKNTGKTLSAWIRARCNRTVTVGEVLQDLRPDLVKQVEIRDVSVLEKAAVSEVIEKKKVRTCTHGVAKGYHCWQCKGLAVMDV